MKVVFMGTPEFAVICLNALLQSPYDIVGVVTVPDKPAGRGKKIRKSAVAEFAEKHHLPLLQPEKLKDPEFLNDLRNWDADAFVVVAFRMLPKEVWKMPPKGTFNLHASLLPQYRGAAPINWAIINGETRSGVTTFLIDEQIDTGNILLKKEVKILPEDDTGSLHDKLAEIGKSLIIETLDGLKTGRLEPMPQTVNEELKPAPKIFPEDCVMDWRKPLSDIHNKIRGLSPYPGARSDFWHKDEKMSFKIFKGRIENEKNADAGQILFGKKDIRIALESGTYIIEELQPEGKRRMKSVDFINGIKDQEGWHIRF